MNSANYRDYNHTRKEVSGWLIGRDLTGHRVKRKLLGRYKKVVSPKAVLQSYNELQ